MIYLLYTSGIEAVANHGIRGSGCEAPSGVY